MVVYFVVEALEFEVAVESWGNERIADLLFYRALPKRDFHGNSRGLGRQGQRNSANVCTSPVAPVRCDKRAQMKLLVCM